MRAAVLSVHARNLVLAAVLALLAVGVMLLYGSRATSQPSAAGDVHVLVATRDIAVGTTGSAIIDGSLAELRTVARADAVADAVVDPARLRGLVATTTIYRGEQVTSRRLGTAAQQGLRASLHGALRLVQVAGDNQQLLAGTLRDGDRVDVLASIRRPESGSEHYARIVLHDLLVVDAAKPSDGSTVDKTASAITLQLTDDEAQRLFWVAKNADWTLLLRPAGTARATAAAPVSATTLLGGTG